MEFYVNYIELMQKSGREFVVLRFDLPDEVVYQRLAGRIVCGECGNNYI